MKIIYTSFPYTYSIHILFVGTIDAAVNGGTSKYQEVFFSPEYALTYPENEALVNALKEGLNQQIALLTRGLELHAQLCPPSMQGLQEKLECMLFSGEKSHPFHSILCQNEGRVITIWQAQESSPESEQRGISSWFFVQLIQNARRQVEEAAWNVKVYVLVIQSVKLSQYSLILHRTNMPMVNIV